MEPISETSVLKLACLPLGEFNIARSRRGMILDFVVRSIALDISLNVLVHFQG